MEQGTKQDLIVAITVIIIVLITSCWLLLSQNNKRENIATCIEKTGNEIECKCVYRECVDRDKEIILKKIEKDNLIK